MFKLLLYSALLHTVFAQSGLAFGKSYLNNSKLCHQWSCINSKLGLPDDLPPKDQFISVLKSHLPQNSWQNAVNDVADACYGYRPRKYINTCPGQALLQCTVDLLIQYCPKESLRKDDACAPLTTLAGFKYMFAQSRYNNLEKNLPKEKRPKWFLKNYFSSKCCNLPRLFNSTEMEECGFNTLVQYHDHVPKNNNVISFKDYHKQSTTPRGTDEGYFVIDIQTNNIDAGRATEKERVKIVNLEETSDSLKMDMDPLECCNISGFIESSWRSECDFKMTWNERYRLTILNHTKEVTTVAPSTTTSTPKLKDVKVVPQTCEKVSCVFRKLNIVSDSGSVDLDAFSKLLDNMTIEHTLWIKAKARVVTKCLSKPIRDYVEECEINKVLACTFDVLSENCPYATKRDPCKKVKQCTAWPVLGWLTDSGMRTQAFPWFRRHTTNLNDSITCQISSSKLRPKNRRQFCGLPNLVNDEVLNQCGLNSLSQLELVANPVTQRPKTHWWTRSNFACQGSTDSTKCLLKKMDVLNRYGFMDYFKMKDRIRTFTSQNSEWLSLLGLYLSTFTGLPMYGQQCSTPKKLLNVLDIMLMTCPMSKRTPSQQCKRILTNIADTAPTTTKYKYEKIMDSYFKPHVHLNLPSKPHSTFQKLLSIREEPKTVTHKTPLYNFGILDSRDAPKVEIIDVKQNNTTKRPLVVLPVYLRNKTTGFLGARPYDGIMRSTPVHPLMPVSQPLPQ